MLLPKLAPSTSYSFMILVRVRAYLPLTTPECSHPPRTASPSLVRLLTESGSALLHFSLSLSLSLSPHSPRSLEMNPPRSNGGRTNEPKKNPLERDNAIFSFNEEHVWAFSANAIFFPEVVIRCSGALLSVTALHTCGVESLDHIQ